MAILKKKAENEGIDLNDEIARLVASQTDTNIRELEGVLAHLLAQVSLKKATITPEMVSKVLSQNAKPTKGKLTIDRIQKTTAKHFSLNENLLVGKTRKQEVAVARQIAMYLCRKMTSSSLETIGLYFGGRDHSTVVHACQTVESKILDEPSFADHIHQITRDVQSATLL
jgi:chromosomal replication initiator protein